MRRKGCAIPQRMHACLNSFCPTKTGAAAALVAIYTNNNFATTYVQEQIGFFCPDKGPTRKIRTYLCVHDNILTIAGRPINLSQQAQNMPKTGLARHVHAAGKHVSVCQGVTRAMLNISIMWERCKNLATALCVHSNKEYAWARGRGGESNDQSNRDQEKPGLVC